MTNMKSQWHPIETAPEGVPHVRAMWVYSVETGRPLYFAANAGYIDDDGDFVSMDGFDEFGWGAKDYHLWAPLPALPSPPGEQK